MARAGATGVVGSSGKGPPEAEESEVRRVCLRPAVFSCRGAAPGTVPSLAEPGTDPGQARGPGLCALGAGGRERPWGRGRAALQPEEEAGREPPWHPCVRLCLVSPQGGR